MNTIVIHPTYFPSISHFVGMIQAQDILLEVEDNFQKQTNRNRMYIYGANGIQLLNIPIKHSLEPHQRFQDVRIDYDENWHRQHLKSLEAAYRSSPYYEYFEDDIQRLYHKKHQFLMDLNLHTHDLICDCLGIKLPYKKTTVYSKEYPTDKVSDLRKLVNGKKDQQVFEHYTQVFEDKHGFMSNLSILDLLFNEGRYAIDYLKNQDLHR